MRLAWIVFAAASCKGTDPQPAPVAPVVVAGSNAAPKRPDAGTIVDRECRAMRNCNETGQGRSDLVACARPAGPTIERGREVLWKSPSGDLGQACWLDPSTIHLTVHHPERPVGGGDLIVYDLEVHGDKVVEGSSAVDSGD